MNMDKTEELRSILRKLPDVYRSGDIEGYLANYAPDLSANYSGLVMNSDEARKFLRSLFEGNGKTLHFQVGEFHMQFNESNDAAVISYPWREKFLFGDGRQTDTEYYETDVWFWRSGEWKIANVHQSTTKEHNISD
jgi:ketosteroid isomerase-like protein